MLRRGDQAGVFYRGDGRPARLYRGRTLIAGWTEQSKEAPAAWDGTYNDAFAVAARGKGRQKTYTGRNLFDPSWLTNLELWEDNDGVYSGPQNRLSAAYGAKTSGFPIVFAEQTQYTISYFIRALSDDQGARFVVTYTDNTTSSLARPKTTREKIEYTTAFGKTVSKIHFTYSTGINGAITLIYFDHVSITQGASAIEFEPYVGGQPSPNPDYPQALEASEGTLRSLDRSGQQSSTAALPTLRAIPGTDIRDTAESLSGGTWRITWRVGVIESYAGESVGDTWASTTGQLTNGATVWHELPTPDIETLDLGVMETYPGYTALEVDGDFPPDATATAKVVSG